MHDPTICSDLAAHRAAYPSDAYPLALRQRAAGVARALRATGATWREIESAIGVSGTSLRHWGEHIDIGAAFVPVVVATHDDTTVSAVTCAHGNAPAPPPTFSVVSPRGFRVDGLDLGQITQLLSQLG